MKKLSLISIVVFLCYVVVAQETPRLPLDLPVSFSGTYGELRHNHFHAGYDFRVGGKIGDPIHAISDGYISRVTVSNTGYGNGLFVTYDDGYTAVHGHLSAFSPQISEKVREAQYENESFAVDLKFQPGDFPVKRGDVIGKVGTTGSSAGPHLHFEFRNGEGTFDYVREGIYQFPDDVKPVISKVYFYGYGDTAPVQESFLIKRYFSHQKRGEVQLLPHYSYVTIDATDRQKGTPGKLAATSYQVMLDNELIFRFEVGDIDSQEDSFIQSLIEYRESYRRGADMVKSQVDPLNILSSKHIESKNNGLIVLDDYNEHSLTIKVSDLAGNSTEWDFKIARGEDFDGRIMPECDSAIAMSWFVSNIFEKDEVRYSLPVGSLYNSIIFRYREDPVETPTLVRYSKVWMIGEESVPQNRRGILEINASQVPETLRSQAFIASLSSSERVSYAGGKWDGDKLKAKVKFGRFFVAVDTNAPDVSFVSLSRGAIRSNGILTVIAKDDLSGIADYRVEIDGKWVLSNLKGSRISVNLKNEGIERGRHDVKVIVTDNCGNKYEEIRELVY